MDKTPENELIPQEMRTKALGLEAAENSAMKQLAKIQAEKKKLAAKAKSLAPPKTTGAEAFEKKATKRDHETSPEKQEWTMAGQEQVFQALDS